MGTNRISSPVGDIFISAKDGFITQLYFDGGRTTPATLKEASGTAEDELLLQKLANELDMYFAGKLQEFTVPVKPTGTEFRKKVWGALLTIPFGETISYKDLAIKINNPKAIRAVGGANHHNPISIIIPCHRVIGANGKLVGYGGGMEAKEFLLNHEKELMGIKQ